MEIIKKEELFVKEDKTVKDAIKVMDSNNSSKAFVVDKNNSVIGTVFSKDIRSSLMNGASEKISVKNIIKEDSDVEEKKKILIVGGAGYLGIPLCKKLLNKKYNVRIIDNFIFGEEPISTIRNNPNLEIQKGDIRNIADITSALKGIDSVILLAGIVGDPATSKIPNETIETNYLATMALAHACKHYQINRFLFASTCSVYGENSKVVTEEDSLNPLSLYARSKIDSERMLLDIKDDNFSPTMLRMATLYGLSPRMRFDLVVNIFAMKATVGEPISIFGGDQWRPFLNVDDAADAYVSCLEAPIEKVAGEIFNVGSQNHTINDVGNFVKEVFPNIKIEFTQKEVLKGALDLRNYRVSFDKLEKATGFRSSKTIQESILDIKNHLEEGKIINVNHKRYYNVEMTGEK